MGVARPQSGCGGQRATWSHSPSTIWLSGKLIHLLSHLSSPSLFSEPLSGGQEAPWWGEAGWAHTQVLPWAHAASVLSAGTVPSPYLSSLEQLLFTHETQPQHQLEGVFLRPTAVLAFPMRPSVSPLLVSAFSLQYCTYFSDCQFYYEPHQGLCHLPQCHPRVGPIPGRLTVCAQGLHGSTGQDLLT